MSVRRRRVVRLCARSYYPEQAFLSRSGTFNLFNPRTGDRARTVVQGRVQHSYHRVSPKEEGDPSRPSAGRWLRRRDSASVADLARELSMKIDPELSGSEGISRVGRSPSLNAPYDRRDRISRSRTYGLSALGDNDSAIKEIGRVVTCAKRRRIDVLHPLRGQCAI